MYSFQEMPDLHGVILAGGGGASLWPLSRLLHPPALLHLPGCGEGRSLIQESVARVLSRIPPQRLILVSPREQELEIRRHLELLRPGLSREITILAEPVDRNTAPAVAWAAQVLARKDPRTLMAVFPGSQLPARPQYLWEALAAAIPVAREGFLVALGLAPGGPETGHGLIRKGLPLSVPSGSPPVYRIEGFGEKPDPDTASRDLAQGGYCRHSGIFLWQASFFLEALGRWRPRLLQDLTEMGLEAGASPPAGDYGRLENISVEQAVMEPHDRGALIPLPGDAGWHDLSTWQTVWEAAPKDQDGNYATGEVLTAHCRRSLLLATHRLVAGLGLEDLLVVETGDALLVAHRQQASQLAKLTEPLEARDAEVYRLPRTVFRPWGAFTVLEEGPGYKVKRIEVYPQGRLSLQLHHHRSENWIAVSGQARVTRGEEVFDLKPQASTFIPRETPHRLENPGTAPAVIIEVQHGDYLGEDDIVRLEDVYGRLL